MKIPQPIPYQGSKRKLANQILNFFPLKVDGKLIEPFAGSGAISIASAKKEIFSHYIINDINEPLVELLNMIVNSPEIVIEKYSYLWGSQLDNPKLYFQSTRENFNKNGDPVELLYLIARSVKNAVRYNDKGEFNQSSDNRRLGKKPIKLQKEIFEVSHLLKGKSSFSNLDYPYLIDNITPNDWVYMDPPYMGTKGSSKRYIETLDLQKFISFLEELNNRDIPFLLSFDGRTGSKEYGQDLPERLFWEKVELHAGKSAQSTLSGKSEDTIESLYISRMAHQIILNNEKLK
ncbi:DNA adenine methylase [Enterococcus faecalis]|nr:DNA adenine methylase [Enterococcus faecalis]